MGTGSPLPKAPETAPEPPETLQLRDGLRERGTSPLPQLAVGENRDRPPLAGRLEVDRARAGGEDRVVAADAYALAGPEAGAALADDDLAAGDFLTGEDLDPQHVGVGFATVAAGAESFLVRHLAFAPLEGRHLEPGQLGAVTGAATVALLRLVFEDFDLRAAQVLGDFGLDLDFAEGFLAGEDFVAAEEHRPQGDFVALLGVEPI